MSVTDKGLRAYLTDGVTDVGVDAATGALKVLLTGGAGGGGGAVTSVDGGIVTIGAKADAAITDYTQTGSLVAFTKGVVQLLSGTGAGAVVPVRQQDGAGNTQPAGDVTGRPVFVSAHGEVADGSSAAAISSLIGGGIDAGGLARTFPVILVSSAPTSTAQYGLVTYSSLAGLRSANVVRPLVTASGFTAGGSAAQTLTVVAVRAITSVTYEQEYNNQHISLLSNSARTATQTSADLVNQNGSAISVYFDITVIPAGGLTLKIQFKDPASGKYVDILTGAHEAAVTTLPRVYEIGPGLPITANVSTNKYVPRIFRIIVTVDDASNITYSVGYQIHGVG